MVEPLQAVDDDRGTSGVEPEVRTEPSCGRVRARTLGVEQSDQSAHIGGVQWRPARTTPTGDLATRLPEGDGSARAVADWGGRRLFGRRRQRLQHGVRDRVRRRVAGAQGIRCGGLGDGRRGGLGAVDTDHDGRATSEIVVTMGPARRSPTPRRSTSVTCEVTCWTRWVTIDVGSKSSQDATARSDRTLIAP